MAKSHSLSFGKAANSLAASWSNSPPRLVQTVTVDEDHQEHTAKRPVARVVGDPCAHVLLELSESTLFATQDELGEQARDVGFPCLGLPPDSQRLLDQDLGVGEAPVVQRHHGCEEPRGTRAGNPAAARRPGRVAGRAASAPPKCPLASSTRCSEPTRHPTGAPGRRCAVRARPAPPPPRTGSPAHSGPSTPRSTNPATHRSGCRCRRCGAPWPLPRLPTTPAARSRAGPAARRPVGRGDGPGAGRRCPAGRRAPDGAAEPIDRRCLLVPRESVRRSRSRCEPAAQRHRCGPRSTRPARNESFERCWSPARAQRVAEQDEDLAPRCRSSGDSSSSRSAKRNSRTASS